MNSTIRRTLYVAVVFDLFFQRAVGRATKADRDASRVMDAPMMAVWRHCKADAPLRHGKQRCGGEEARP